MNLKEYSHPIILDERHNQIKLYYNEQLRYIYFRIENTKTIVDKGHARAIRRKTKFKDIIPGDILYTQLYWKESENSFGLVEPSQRTGIAISRKGKILWYSMPGVPEGCSTREILTEKYSSSIIFRKAYNTLKY